MHINFTEIENVANIKVANNYEVLFDNGFIGQFAKYCKDTAPYVCWPSITAGALSMTALLAGQHYRLFNGIRPHVYTLALAPSSSGKDFPRQVITSLAVKLGVMEKIPTKIASAQGIEDAVLKNGTLLMLLDEVAEVLAIASKDKSSVAQTMNGFLLELFTASVLSQRVLAVDKHNPRNLPPVEYPAVSMFGTSIYEKLFSTISERSFIDGLLNRCLVFADESMSKKATNNDFNEPPPDLIDFANLIRQPNGKTIGDIDMSRTIITAEQSERERLLELQTAWDDFYNRSNDLIVKSISGRAYEMTCKIATLFCLSENRRCLKSGDIDRAEVLAFQSVATVLAGHSSYAGDGDYEKCVQSVERLVKAHSPIPWRVLLQRLPRKFGRSNVVRAVVSDAVEKGLMQWLKPRDDEEDESTPDFKPILTYQRGCYVEWI